MDTKSKKMDMAGKMYTEAGKAVGKSPVYSENGKGGKGVSPKYAMKGKNSKFDASGMMDYTQNSKGSNRKGGISPNMSGGNEKFSGLYSQ